MAIKLVIFDLDDTIVVNTMPFSEMRERILKKIGRTDGPKHLYEFLKAMGEDYVKILEEEEIKRARRAKIHPALPKILDYLDSRGIKKSVLTRNCREAALIALGSWASKFDMVLTRDDDFAPKPSPEAVMHILEKLNVRPEECLMVGDYLYDMQAGKSAGCLTACIGEWDADFHLKSLEDLLNILERLITDLPPYIRQN